MDGLEKPDFSKPDYGLEKVNDGVYLAQKGEKGRRGPQIVFIHGLQVQENKNLYFETWLSADGRDLWPKTWLSESFPTAAIYLVHYDSCTWKDDTSGRMDMFVTAEKLLQELLHADIGQSPRNPVILVGQDVGGLVIKEICVHASRKASSVLRGCLAQKACLFLEQVKGIFYFSTPHGGLHHWDQDYQGELMKTLKVHNAEASRTNDEFRKLRSERKWSAYGLGASLPGVVEVKEAAGRVDVDNFCTVDAETMNICRLKDRKSSTFGFLENFIKVTVSGFTNPKRPKLPFNATFIDRYVPLRQTEREIRQRLEDPAVQVVVLYGDAGTGKSSLVMYLALQFEEMESVSPFWDGPFWDGIFYFEVERGLSAKTVLLEVLHELGVDKEEIFRSSDNENELISLLKKKLENLNALMIFDDVRDDDLTKWVEKVVVPQAKEVKYLFLAQSDAWRRRYSTHKIEKIDLNTAQEIIVKHVGLRDNKLPESDEEIINEIIVQTDYHPLALATISSSVETDSSGRVRRADWEDLKQNLLYYLGDDAEVAVAGFGKSYPRSVFAAMMNAVDLLCTKDKGSLHLMCTMALFKSPVPTSVVHMFRVCTVPLKVSRHGFRLVKKLIGLQLLQRASISSGKLVGEGNLWAIVGAPVTYKIPRLMMHSLRQRFIITCAAADYDPGSTCTSSVEVIKEILAPYLSGRAHEKEGHFSAAVLVTALCALYGVDEVKNTALRKLYNYQLKISVRNVAFEHDYSRMCLEVVMAKIEEHSTSEKILSALQEVVWRYIFELQVDDKNLSFLITEGYERALEFLWFHVSGLPYKETPDLPRQIQRSLVSAVSLLRQRNALEMQSYTRNLQVLLVLERIAFFVMVVNEANIDQLPVGNDVFDLEALINVLHSVRNDPLIDPTWTLFIQIFGNLTIAPSVKRRVVAVLLRRPDVHKIIAMVSERHIEFLEAGGRLREYTWEFLKNHGYSRGDPTVGFLVYPLVVAVDTVLKATNLLCMVERLRDDSVVDVVQAISIPLEIIARFFQQGVLNASFWIYYLIPFNSIPLKRDQARRLITWSIPGAIEGIVSVVLRFQEERKGTISFALSILEDWARADEEVRSWLFTHEGFLAVLVEVIGYRAGPVVRVRSAVRLIEQFATSDGEAASVFKLVFRPRLHHVLSDLLVRHPEDIKKSALTAFLYLGYQIGGTYDMGLRAITPEHSKSEVTNSLDLAAKVQDAFESLFSLIFNNGQRATQVAALKLLNYLLLKHLTARARIYAMPTTATGLAKLLHEDEPQVHEEALLAILLLGIGYQNDAANGFLRQIALIPGALEKLVEFLGYDWNGRSTAIEFLFSTYLEIDPKSSSRMLPVGTVIPDMVVFLQNSHQHIHNISATLLFLLEFYRESRKPFLFSVSGSVEALVELVEQSGLALQRVRSGEGDSGAESLRLTNNCFASLFNLASQSQEAISRLVTTSTGRISDLVIELIDERNPKEVQMLAVQFLSYLATPMLQVMERPDFVEKFSLLLHSADPEEEKIHVMSLAFSLASRRSLPEKITELVSGALQESVDLLTNMRLSGPQELVPRVLRSLWLLVENFAVARPFIIRASGAIETLISWSIDCKQDARATALHILRLSSTTAFQDIEFTSDLLKVLNALPKIVSQLRQTDSLAELVSGLQFLKSFVVFAMSAKNERTLPVFTKLRKLMSNPRVLQNLAALLQIDEPQCIPEDVMFVLSKMTTLEEKDSILGEIKERVIDLACRGNSAAFSYWNPLIVGLYQIDDVTRSLIRVTL